MPKVTIVFEDREDGLHSHFDVFDPGRDLQTITNDPSPAEALGLMLIEMLKGLGGTVGKIIDDAEYHAGEHNG